MWQKRQLSEAEKLFERRSKMKRAKILLVVVPLLILGLVLGTGTALACPDGPAKIAADGSIVVPPPGDSASTVAKVGTAPATVGQTSTNIISLLIPLAASASLLAIAATQ